MKVCKRCRQERPLGEFYKHKGTRDGRLSFCKECKRAEQRRRYDENMQDPEWVAKERERTRERNLRLGYWEKYKRNRTREQQDKVNEHRYRFRRRNPDKARAHNRVSKALRTGKLQKKPCDVCGATKVEAHHEDYTKPLEVIWLCRKHHAEIHRLD